jgi:hypothetical protein
MAEKKVIELDLQTNVGSLKSQLKQAQADVQTLSDKFGATSQAAAEAAKKAADLKDRIQDAKALTDAFNPDAKFTSLTRSIGGALDGFQAFEGALGLIGVESEDLQKTLLKVQSAMAFSQGIQGALEAKDSFIQLGSVVKNTFSAMTAASKAFMIGGIGLLITVIAVAADAMGAFGDSTEEVEKKQKKLEKQLKATNDQIAQTKKSTSDYADILDGQTQRELNNAKKRGASDKELSNITLSGAKKRLSVLEEEVDTAMKLYLKYSSTGSQKQYDAAADALTQAQAQRDALAAELEGMDADAKATAIQNSKDRAKEAREQAAAVAKAKQEVVDKADADAKRNALEKQQEFDNAIEDIAEQNYLNTLNNQQKEELAVQDKYFTLETLAGENKDALAEIELAKMNELNDINLKYQDLDYKQKEEAKLKLAEATKKASEKEIAAAKAVAEQKAAIQMQGLDTALQGVQLIKGLFEKQKGVQKAAVIAESAIGIAKMIIANKLANVAALATPQAVATSGVAAAPVIAMNNISTGIGIAANIAATAKALRTLGGGSPPSSPSGGGGGGAGSVMSANFNVVGNSGLNQLGQLQQKPMKAYVVSGDMTTAQSLDRNRIENATLVQ